MMYIKMEFSENKTTIIMDKIINSKSKPYFGSGEMYAGVVINKNTGNTEYVLPKNAAPDTIGYNSNRVSQIEKKVKTRLRLQHKLNAKKNKN
jgi:hypothetical protein